MGLKLCLLILTLSLWLCHGETTQVENSKENSCDQMLHDPNVPSVCGKKCISRFFRNLNNTFLCVCVDQFVFYLKVVISLVGLIVLYFLVNFMLIVVCATTAAYKACSEKTTTTLSITNCGRCWKELRNCNELFCKQCKKILERKKVCEKQELQKFFVFEKLQKNLASPKEGDAVFQTLYGTHTFDSHCKYFPEFP